MAEKQRVALVGIGCRYCQIQNLQEFQKVLENEISKSSSLEKRFREYQERFHPDSDAEGKFYAEKGYFINEDPQRFDADFFHISYKEAECMDYQQRMLLQVTQEALEDGGILIKGTESGVFVGAFMQDFLTTTMQVMNYDYLNGFHATGSSIGMLANRLSYYYDLHGPSMAVDTACSSSLTALHLAAKSISQGTCAMAICAGVNIITEVGNFITLCKGGFLSKESLCQTFGEQADGYARGEGVGVLVLKNLEQAISDKDHIYCEIVSTAVNHDGRKKGINYPNRAAQISLLKKIYGKNKISIDDIGYLEAHGTGTQAGDRTEVSALQEVFHARKELLTAGSVKTNIGHTEAAAGIASVIKGVLTLNNKMIYKSLHCEKRNTDISWESGCIQPANDSSPLKAALDGRYYVGINGFGFGGSNAHVVLGSILKEKECVPNERKTWTEGVQKHMFCLSANSETSLYGLARDYMDRIQAGTLRHAALGEICACMSLRREQDYPYRLAMTVDSKFDLAGKLSEFLYERLNSDILYKHQPQKRKKIAVLFSGMGVQQEEMGKELYRKFKVFKETFQNCSRAFVKAGGVDLIQAIEDNEAYEHFWEIGFLQPYNLAYQISLFELIRSFGIKIDGCLGHSAGELAAFYCSGFLSLEESFRIAYHRGRVQQKQQGKGRMMAVGISRRKAEKLCRDYPGRISLGVVNGNEDIVLSGDEACLREIQSAGEEGGYSRFLKGDVAYHSCQMDDVKEDFLSSLLFGQPGHARLELYSTVYAERIDNNPERYDNQYWWMNIRNTVEFYRTAREMLRNGYDGFIEIGAAPVLKHYMDEVYSDKDYSYVIFQKKQTSETEAFFRGLNQAYVNHIPIDFCSYYDKQPMLALPKYYWDWKVLPNCSVKNSYIKEQETNGWLGDQMNFPLDMWEKRMNQASQPWVTGHRVEQDCYIPAAAYIAMLYETGEKVLNNLEIVSPVVVERTQDVILNLTKYPDGIAAVGVSDVDRKNWHTCLRAVFGKENPRKMDRYVCPEFKENGMLALERDTVYQILDEKALHYSGKFQRINKIYIGTDTAYACLEAEEGYFEKENMTQVLDSMLQAVALAGNRDMSLDRTWIYIPNKIETSVIYDNYYKELKVYARIRERKDKELIADTFLLNEDGVTLAAFYGIHFAAKARSGFEEVPSYLCSWEMIGELTEDYSKDQEQSTGRIPKIYVAQGELYEDLQQLLHMIQALGDHGELAVITENAVKVQEGDLVYTKELEGIRSLCRCMAQEYPQISFIMIDTDQLEDTQRLLKERRLWDQETELAVRKGVIYGMRLKQIEGKREACISGEDLAVITGASGGLAYPYAMALAGAGAKKIALISRQGAKKTRTLSEVLTYYGVNVRHCKVDVTSFSETADCLDALKRETKGELYVHHLAGYSEDCRSESITKGVLERHLQPKVKGAKNLLAALGEKKSNAVLVGSLIAILGNHGQGAYAAANGILKEISEQAGCRYIGFGAMNTGMLKNRPDAVRAFEAQGISVMDAESAVRQALSMSSDTGYVTRMNWKKVLEQRNSLGDKKYSYVRNKTEEAGFLDIWRRKDKKEQWEQMQEFLIGVYAQILDIDRKLISTDRPLETMGIHSLGAAMASNNIRHTLGIRLTPEQASGSATIKELAGEIQKQLLAVHQMES